MLGYLKRSLELPCLFSPQKTYPFLRKKKKTSKKPNDALEKQLLGVEKTMEKMATPPVFKRPQVKKFPSVPFWQHPTSSKPSEHRERRTEASVTALHGKDGHALYVGDSFLHPPYLMNESIHVCRTDTIYIYT